MNYYVINCSKNLVCPNVGLQQYEISAVSLGKYHAASASCYTVLHNCTQLLSVTMTLKGRKQKSFAHTAYMHVCLRLYACMHKCKYMCMQCMLVPVYGSKSVRMCRCMPVSVHTCQFMLRWIWISIPCMLAMLTYMHNIL